jgi:hypothetical protein
LEQSFSDRPGAVWLMTNIVERLRKRAGGLEVDDLMDEAADEIERLRAALDEIIMECTCDAIETARAALEGKP